MTPPALPHAPSRPGAVGYRIAYARALAEVVERGVQRRDTEHPVFCGCYDWHSCVHGLYSLVVASHLTGERRWKAVAESRLDPRGLERERADLAAGRLDRERPYGLAWLLLLARTREGAGGDERLRPLAHEAARRLAAWVGALDAEGIARTVRHREYDNLSWAVSNLAAWADWIGDAETAAFVRDVAARELLPPAAPSWWEEDRSEEGFFPPALMRLLAVVEVLGPGGSRPALAEAARHFVEPEPIRTPRSVHPAGLNFSRCWGYWTLYRHTGDRRFRRAFHRAFIAQVQAPAYWRDHYEYAHWVPQFGIHALALSADERPARTDSSNGDPRRVAEPA